MKKEEILEIIKQILVEKFNKKVEWVNMETNLAFGSENSLELESLEIVSLIVFLEEKFQLIIDYDVLFNTLGDIVQYLQEKKVSPNGIK